MVAWQAGSGGMERKVGQAVNKNLISLPEDVYFGVNCSIVSSLSVHLTFARPLTPPAFLYTEQLRKYQIRTERRQCFALFKE